MSSSSIDNIGNALYSQTEGRQSLAVSAISRGAAAAQAKNYPLAVAEFRRATAYDPTDPNAYMYMAQVYAMMGQPSDEVAAYKKALVADPVNADAKVGLANTYIGQKNYGDAEKLLKQVAMSDPTNATPPTTLGFIYMNTDRLAEADTQFSKVAISNPTSATAKYNLGLLRNKQGKYSEAVDLFQRSLSLDPKSENTYADLAYAYMGLGKPDEAQLQYGKLLSFGTSNAYTLAGQVSQAINTPKMIYEDSTMSNFSSLLGPGTSVSALDSSLAKAGATKVFKMTFKFNQGMNVGSITNISNWSITKASGGTAGTYNNGANLQNSKEVGVSPLPLSVTYDPSSHMATVYFRVTQNANADGVIDPKHLVFKFTGKDIYDRKMDASGDQYDGESIIPF